MLKRIIKTSIFSLGSRGFLTLNNLVLMYAVGVSLGNEQLGIYAISVTLYYLFGFLTSFELTTYFSKEVAHTREHPDVLKKLLGEVTTAFILGMGCSVILLMILLVTYKEIDQNMIWITALAGAIFGLEKNLAGVLLGQEKMHIEFMVQLIALCFVAVPTYFYAEQLDITGIYILRTAVSLFSIPLRLVYSGLGRVFWQKIRFSFQSYKEVAFFAASGFAIYIQYHLDPYILSFLIPKEQLGDYAVALRIFLSFCLLAEITSLALTPYVSRVFRNQEGAGEKATFAVFYKKIVLTSMVLGVSAAATLLLTREWLVKLFGSGKANLVLTSEYLCYFSLFLFFRFVSFYIGDVLTATRYQHLRFYILLSSTLLLIALELILGRKFLVYGIIYARAIIELFLFSAYFIIITRIRAKQT